MAPAGVFVTLWALALVVIERIYPDVIDLWTAASVAQLDAPSDWRPEGRGFNPR